MTGAALAGAALAAAALLGGTASAAATADDRHPHHRPESGPVHALYGSENRTIRTHRHVVALTFNAAWNAEGIGTVLRALRRADAPATFFLTGDFAERHPAAARALAEAGHGIGNHSYSHRHIEKLTPGERAAEVLRADHALRAATGTAPLPFFRFPYGATTPRAIADVNRLGFADIEFTTDTNGWKGTRGGMTVRRAVRRAVEALRPGAILQMHVGAPEGQDTVLDAEALPRIIDACRDRGYEITDLRGLLGPA
ncbi:polysaccharide deacetylase family protein [Streptomyces iconiensis]|uniref:Polysaccharide deacetylase family protein n=1 Tax=Streptomyces iconiensis TaxID=1384038 RepID=A0ABT7A323_9ACTN|nr:polysaccharide deacetylase family protein [Streptomyces iconiensis]MDJ1135462.1 polysaccharide deacetylase family protein [Streptomyces iconiensis]